MFELMVTLAIGGILVALAVPNLSRFLQDEARASHVNSLVTALSLARAEAVSRGVRATLCPGSEADGDCSPSADGGEWIYETGWLVKVPGEPGNPDRIVQVFAPGMGANVTLRGPVSRVEFSPVGLPVGGGTWVRYCDARGETEARIVQLAGSGRPESRAHEGSGDAAGNCP